MSRPIIKKNSIKTIINLESYLNDWANVNNEPPAGIIINYRTWYEFTRQEIVLRRGHLQAKTLKFMGIPVFTSPDIDKGQVIVF